MIDLQQAAAARDEQKPRTGWIVGGLVAIIVLCLVGGVVYTLYEANTPPPAFPAPPPHARNIGAGQVTQQLGSNQIVSVALYRVDLPPAAVIAYYKRVSPGHGGTIGRFNIVVHSGDAGAIPTALHELPRVFVDGKGSTARATYTFTEYASNGEDVGIAVDLRHPKGPTLVFVDMLSA